MGGGTGGDSSPARVLCCSIPGGEEIMYFDVGGRYVALHMFGGDAAGADGKKINILPVNGSAHSVSERASEHLRT